MKSILCDRILVSNHLTSRKITERFMDYDPFNKESITACYRNIQDNNHYDRPELASGLLAYNQKIHWHPCKGHKKFLCSSIPVPLSYSDSSKGLINIPILLHKANIKSKGTIFFNFGGPGVPSFKFFRFDYKHLKTGQPRF